MIRYALACSNGHDFEGWFRSSSDFDDQAARGLLACPHCGTAAVAKALMAPRVVSRRSERGAAPPADAAPADAALAAVPAAGMPAAPVPAAMVPPEIAERIAKLREIKQALLASSENVGERFADEARKIHYGEAPARPVHGQASPDEAKALIDEGVGILPLPVLPEERN